ncbi:MAG: MarR family transcriptional regulator [Steroidobacteraceae bacterium]|jgi:MarR family transcriptional regulator for hemolysin
MPELEERFADVLHGAARIWRQAIDRRLKHLGMSQASWMTIAVASKAPIPLSQSELADRLGVEGATMVAMVDRLVKAGFIVRQPCRHDRRINRVVLTEAGNRLVETVQAETAAVRKELLASIDPAKLAIATELLETLHRLIERSE